MHVSARSRSLPRLGECPSSRCILVLIVLTAIHMVRHDLQVYRELIEGTLSPEPCHPVLTGHQVRSVLKSRTAPDEASNGYERLFVV